MWLPLNLVKIAIIGLLVGAVGVDFSVAQHVSFLELPQNPAIMQQAEDRAHRHGQINTVNIYIFCAKDTSDESHWQKLNKSLRRVSSTTNGKYDAIHEIAVEDVFDLERSKKADGNGKQDLESAASCELSCDPLKFSNSALAGDKQLCEAYDETAIVTSDKVNEQCEISGKSTQKQDLQIKADRILKLANQKGSFSEGQLGKNDSGAEIESAVQTSVCQLDEGQENHMPWDKMQADSNFHYRTESDKDGSFQQVEAERIDQANFLRFEVSQYTGRIHLYSCIPGTDSRPRPLFVNFRPEDIDLLDSPAVNEKSAFKIIKENPSYRDVLLAFVNEWNNLRPIEQRKLLRKPLQLPLAVELCYLEDSINHNSGGLLKCRSKRRATPLSDISHRLPADAAWRKVHISSGYGRKDKEYTQGWTLANEPLCKLCQTPCKSSNAMTPEFFEDLFCNLGCYEEFRLRTSNRFLRQELFQIEHGVCATCQLDCHKLVRHIKPLPVARRQKYIEKVAPNIAKQKKLLDKLVNDPIEGNAWHADHIVPVYRGGGECRLENMRTLCVACHFDVTAAQRVERNSTRTKAKKQLKVLMSDLRNGQGMKSTGGTDTSLKEQGKSTDFEDELLIKVPGSAYSREESTIDATEGLEKEPRS